MTATVEVFDPAMCCSTGICGPSVDPVLPRFAADLDWLKEHGVQVTRHNLSQEPAAFVAAPAVQAALTARGTDCLPFILVDGCIVSQGTYPTRAELARWTGLDGNAPTRAEVPKSSCCGPTAATDTSTAGETAPAKSRCCG
jgi:arsenite methyltransferase